MVAAFLEATARAYELCAKAPEEAAEAFLQVRVREP
jgi:hypothetical protein